ncbi:MAG: hypothetical protein KAG97_07470, partial [Victivallales bacterium]|nr:hypothetical protein [Victivallales bacterium]
RDYYRFSLDLDFLREMWPTLERILASSAWEKEDNGLLNGTDNMQVFIDWGILASERSGNSSAALNAFWIDSIDCAAELAAALGNETRSKELQTESAQLRAAVSGTLWMPEEKRYAASLNEDGSFADTPAIHANILALLYRIGTDKQLEQVLTYMEAHLATNMERMSSMEGGQIELYFFFYTLQALYQNGRIEYAENLVRENYTVMMERDPGTLWEGIHCGLINKFSRCHSWGGGPMIYGSRYILGVQFPNPSDPNEVQIEPMAETIDWAKGVYPHPLGDIIVSWKRVEGVIELDYTVPEGITVVD